MMRESELINTDIEAYLALHEKKDLLRFMTCGSVDDGKSTLIGRLLYDSKQVYEDHLRALETDSIRVGKAGEGIDFSLLLDGLKAEREQGITIDVAYRFFTTEKRKFIIADTPGHEQYTRNMITGGSTADLAVILVDARLGVLTQTRRHSFLASLLRIKHVVVAINKMDLVEYSEDRFETLRHDYSDFAARLELSDVQFIPISALRGDNVVEPSDQMPWYRGPTLLHYLENVHIASDRNLIDLRFPVQYVIRPDGSFRGYAGTLVSGIIRRGDEILALPSGKKNRVKSIVTFDGEPEEAFAPMAVTLELEKEIDISRGTTLVRVDNVPYTSRRFEAMLVWMADEPLVMGREYIIKHTNSSVSGQVTSLRYRIDVNTLHRETVDRLALNEIGRVGIELTRPISYDPYGTNREMGSFIVIDRATNGTVGAGMIIDRRTQDADTETDTETETETETGGHVGARKSTTAGPKSTNLRSHQSLVSPDARAARAGQTPCTIWLTGLPFSGKTPIAYALERRLHDLGYLVTVIAGSTLRRGLSIDLGFKETDRSENIRRAASVARLMNDAGLITIAAFVTPLRSDREVAKAIIAPHGCHEVFVGTSIETCEQRDEDGLYARARRGEVENFSGVSAPYEAPTSPEVVLSLDNGASIDAAVDAVVVHLERSGALKRTSGHSQDKR
ncbi:MAG: sulfate adenylyltransferase subunit CysN [Deltaproteobacteria bacterium]|nr:sulfate adenylyltransferase subunit CysN [Deltaproteobacteria bacterium]